MNKLSMCDNLHKNLEFLSFSYLNGPLKPPRLLKCVLSVWDYVTEPQQAWEMSFAEDKPCRPPNWVHDVEWYKVQ